MRHIHRTAAILILLLNTLALRAETIVVTSKLDRGPGTLWEAIDRANANGTADRDRIHFNLPGTTLADRTIILDKLELPALSSNIEIDGTTQPGTAFGISGAKVRLLKTSLVGAGFFHMLKVFRASDVAIYGLHMDFRIPETGAYCISLFDSENVTIGAPGKGNVLNAAGGGIGTDVVTPGNTAGIHIAYNIIGLEPDGTTLPDLGGGLPKMQLWSAADVEIDHNQINAEVIMQEFAVRVMKGNRVYNIHDNIWSGDAAATVARGKTRLFISCQAIPGVTETQILVLNNHFLSGYMELQCGYGEIKVQGNKVNTDITGTVYTADIFESAVTVWNTGGKTLIGGDLPAEKNYIAGGIHGVYVKDYHNATIKKNSIFCTSQRGIEALETVFMETFSGNTITGRSEPNALIEVYEADHCNPRSECTGKVLIGTTTANAAGQWSFTGALTPDVVVTGTNQQGATSMFTRAAYNIQQLEIIPSLCGAPGSITGVVVSGAVTMQWEDASGNVVGNTPDLLLAPPGTYYLYVSTSNDPHSDCAPQYLRIDIRNTKPNIIQTSVTTVNPCGSSGGSILNMIVTEGYQNTMQWLNERDEIVGTDLNLVNVPAGTYRLFVYSTPTCFAVSDPVVLADRPAPVINVSNMTVTPATCMNDNGTISNIQLSGTGTLAIRWLDANDNVIGNTEDLQNLAAGAYRLELDDQGACSAVISAPVVINSEGAITLDITQMKIQPAGCNSQPGSITGILANGASDYTWRNRAGTVVGNGADLAGVPAGEYMLTLGNSYNCSAQTVWITLPSMQASGWNVKGEIHLPICNESNGEVRITDISGAQVTDIRWTNAATNTTLGNGRTLANIGPGDYKLYLTDQDGCELEVYTASIPQRILPVLDGVPQITDETCGMANGSIIMPAVNGSGPFQVQWTDVSGALMGTEREVKSLKAGSYFVEAMDQYGCTVKSNACFVENVSALLEPPADQSITIGKGLPLRITVAVSYPAIYTLYADASGAFPLQQNITGVFVLPGLQQDASYYVTASADICKSPPAKVTVKAVDQITVGVPTAFTPNGDGMNDVFRPQYSMISSLESFSVYSRWGNEVFTTKTIGAGWNGRMNGTDLPAGSYFYIIRGKDVLGNPFQVQGSILLMR
ncbi:gliding motility-associated C-terminal domain-containing protein [Chitinophaga barathri]|uniref:Gliding motility-associated C-terminal domain-containing protein n=1 Tax=Chitinophaga barathri TaxID=1647451 RepID=A0A3N4MJI7_9BACT|nr:gliding motility-associated C-terminal domain-containing protein [Chitinophaga barathri]RPD42226.1 gliding motility-associated C-terminal domain-containing protein [Chitinophaga barathri]